MTNDSNAAAKVLALLGNAQKFISEKQGACDVLTSASAVSSDGASFSNLLLCGMYVEEFWEVQQSEY